MLQKFKISLQLKINKIKIEWTLEQFLGQNTKGETKGDFQTIFFNDHCKFDLRKFREVKFLVFTLL